MIIPNIWENESHVPVTTTQLISSPFCTVRSSKFHVQALRPGIFFGFFWGPLPFAQHGPQALSASGNVAARDTKQPGLQLAAIFGSNTFPPQNHGQCTQIWLVVSIPLKNMKVNKGMMTFPLYGKIIQSCSKPPTRNVLWIIYT